MAISARICTLLLCLAFISNVAVAQTVTISPQTGGGDNTSSINGAITGNQEVILTAGDYPISGPINCGATHPTWIHGAGNIANVATLPSPLANVFLTSTSGFLSSDTAVVNLGAYCRWSGVSVNTANFIDNSVPIDTVNIDGTHVGIDDHALLINRRYNINCGTVKVAGLQVKDVQLIKGTLGNFYAPTQCANVRLIGDLISGAMQTSGLGGAGVLFGSEDLSIEGGVIEQSDGPGLDLDGAASVSVTGMYFDDNGKHNFGGGQFSPGILIKNSNWVSVCGNHFHRNSGNDTDGSGVAHIQFSGTSNNS